MIRTRTLTTRLDEVTMARLAQMAKRTGVSVSMQARIILVAALRDGHKAETHMQEERA